MRTGFFLEPEFLVLMGVAVATLVFFFYVRRRSGLGVLLALGIFAFFCGLIIFVLSSLHLIAVISRPISGRGLGNAPAFTYDFRFYSLVLVGLLIAVPGFICVVAARGLTRDSASAWRTALWSNLLLLAVNGPLIPIQGFATGFSALALLNLAGLVASRKKFLGSPDRQAAKSAASFQP